MLSFSQFNSIYDSFSAIQFCNCSFSWFKFSQSYVLWNEKEKAIEDANGDKAEEAKRNYASYDACFVRSIVAVVASDWLLSSNASTAIFSLSLLFLSIAAHTHFATALCAHNFVTAVILAADDGTTNFIGRIFAAYLDLAFSSSRSFFSSYVCLDLQLSNHLCCWLSSWFGSQLGSWLGIWLSLLHHHRLHHHHVRILLDRTRLLHNHAKLHLNHAMLSGYLHHATLQHARLRRLGANQHLLWLGRGVIRGGSLWVRLDWYHYS